MKLSFGGFGRKLQIFSLALVIGHASPVAADRRSTDGMEDPDAPPEQNVYGAIETYRKFLKLHPANTPVVDIGRTQSNLGAALWVAGQKRK